MWQDFEGGVYWDELADRCGDISMAMGFRSAVGNTVFDHRCNKSDCLMTGILFGASLSEPE